MCLIVFKISQSFLHSIKCCHSGIPCRFTRGTNIIVCVHLNSEKRHFLEYTQPMKYSYMVALYCHCKYIFWHNQRDAFDRHWRSVRVQHFNPIPIILSIFYQILVKIFNKWSCRARKLIYYTSSYNFTKPINKSNYLVIHSKSYTTHKLIITILTWH